MEQTKKKNNLMMLGFLAKGKMETAFLWAALWKCFSWSEQFMKHDDSKPTPYWFLLEVTDSANFGPWHSGSSRLHHAASAIRTAPSQHIPSFRERSWGGVFSGILVKWVMGKTWRDVLSRPGPLSGPPSLRCVSKETPSFRMTPDCFPRCQGEAKFP